MSLMTKRAVIVRTEAKARPVDQTPRMRLLWILSLLLLFAISETRPVFSSSTGLHRAFDITGEMLVIAGVLGRSWSTLFIGGRKSIELVTSGPYSMTRNPLYFSSMLVISGICLMSGSIIVSIVFPVLYLWLFIHTANREAAFLERKFGSEFAHYARRTPLFWPGIRLFENTDVKVRSTTFLRSGRDGVLMLLAIPAVGFIEYLRDSPVYEPLLTML